GGDRRRDHAEDSFAALHLVLLLAGSASHCLKSAAAAYARRGKAQGGKIPQGPDVQEKAAAAEATRPAIAVSGLRRGSGGRAALDGVGFELDAGATMVVLGPNGAGKTTLLRILATLLRPSGGEVVVLGCSLPKEAWRLRGRIGYLGHEPLLYRDLS